jgi:hypothetical protein
MEARLAFLGHALMENRSGLIVDDCLTPANGHAERIAALAMIEPRADFPVALTLGADKGYDGADFVNELRSMNVRPHVARNTTRRSSAGDARTTRHPGYTASQRIPQADRGGIRLDERPSAACDGRCYVAPIASVGPSHSRPPPTTSSGYRSCWPPERRPSSEPGLGTQN